MFAIEDHTRDKVVNYVLVVQDCTEVILGICGQGLYRCGCKYLLSRKLCAEIPKGCRVI